MKKTNFLALFCGIIGVLTFSNSFAKTPGEALDNNIDKASEEYNDAKEKAKDKYNEGLDKIKIKQF